MLIVYLQESLSVIIKIQWKKQIFKGKKKRKTNKQQKNVFHIQIQLKLNSLIPVQHWACEKSLQLPFGEQQEHYYCHFVLESQAPSSAELS